MTDQRIIEEIAKLEGWKFETNQASKIRFSLHENQNTFDKGIPDYLNSHDACQRVIDGMSEHHSLHLAYHLRKMLTWSTAQYYTSDIQIGLVLKATPRQKCEAILKAYDKWEEEDKSNEVR